MHDGHTVVDVDAHYVEALEDLAAYMDEPWRTRLREADSTGLFFPGSSGSRRRWGRIQRDVSRPMEPADVPEAMDFLGVDKSIVLSQVMLAAASVEADDDRPAVFARAYLEYMLDAVVDPANDVYTAVPLPYQDPPEAAAIVDDVSDEPGVVAGCIVTSGAEPPLGNRRYDVVYEALADAGLPVIFHTGGSGLDQYHRKGYGTFIETHVLGFLESNLSQLTSLVVQGVPEKFPDLEVVFMESGVFWVPMLMARLDEEYLKRTDEAPLLDRRPSEYMREFYYGTQPLERSVDEAHLQHVVEMMDGADTLMYASDYPHWDYDRPGSVSELSFLSSDEKARVLAGNAEAVFGI